ncbi:helix-turn-helix transcriptional regulator, partial [Streptomyces sp. NPDC004838]
MTQSTAHSAAGTPLPSPKERRRLRRAKSLSEEQVASAIGVTKATVRAWETGRSDPQGRRREAYAKLLAAPVTKAGTTAGATAEVTPEVTPEVTAQPEARPRPEPEPEPERVFGTVAGVSEKGAGPASESVSESE